MQDKTPAVPLDGVQDVYVRLNPDRVAVVWVKVPAPPPLEVGQPYYTNKTPAILADNFTKAFAELKRVVASAKGTVLNGFKYLDDFEIVCSFKGNELDGVVPTGQYLQVGLVTEKDNVVVPF